MYFVSCIILAMTCLLHTVFPSCKAGQSEFYKEYNYGMILQYQYLIVLGKCFSPYMGLV